MNKRIGFAAGLMLAAIVLVTLAMLFSPSLSEEQAFNKTIKVSGSGTIKTTPDEARVMIAVVSEELTAEDAAEMNSASMTKIFAELKEAGIRDVKTSQYSITPIYSWIEEETLTGKEQKSVIVGYRATNSVKVVCEPEEAGTAVDAAVRGGANRIDSISFQLSDALRERTYNDALRKAVSNARSKADVVADSLGITRIYPVTVTVDEYYYMDYPPVPVPRAASAISEEVVTPITPSEVEVNARVSIVYDF